jgi:hypothetical protein
MVVEGGQGLGEADETDESDEREFSVCLANCSALIKRQVYQKLVLRQNVSRLSGV